MSKKITFKGQIKDGLQEKIEKGLDPVGRGLGYDMVPLDDTFPEYILNNKEKYADFILE